MSDFYDHQAGKGKRRFSKSNGFVPKSERVCYHCQGIGHHGYECWKNPDSPEYKGPMRTSNGSIRHRTRERDMHKIESHISGEFSKLKMRVAGLTEIVIKLTEQVKKLTLTNKDLAEQVQKLTSTHKNLAEQVQHGPLPGSDLYYTQSAPASGKHNYPFRDFYSEFNFPEPQQRDASRAK